MARAIAAAVLAIAVCCLLVAPAPARRPADLPPRAVLHTAVDREAAAEPLRPKPAAGAGCGEAADEQGTALAVPEEDPARGEEEDAEPRKRSSLLCLVFWCGGEPAHAGGALVARGSSDEPAAMGEWTQPTAAVGKVESEGEERPYETDSDSDCDSDSDDEDEGGILGWLWSLADRF